MTSFFRSQKRFLSSATNLVRNNWTREEIREIYKKPLLNLVYDAATVHRQFHDPSKIQQCTLLSIKTGGCTEDCGYCAQSSRYSTGVKATRLMKKDEVLEKAKIAKAKGSTRFCMGSAWRDLNGRTRTFKNICDIIKGVRELDMEVCVTLGMLNDQQAKELKEAGLTAYNHNVDTSREYYSKIITTRTYDDRLNTLGSLRHAGLKVCSGGILGLGEKEEDRIGLIHTLSTLPLHPESVPINALVPIPGTPVGDKVKKPVRFTDLLRTVATARICMPKSIIRFSAGRMQYSESEQAFTFLAGANSVFTGDKMLTTPAVTWDEDSQLFHKWGLEGLKSFEYEDGSSAQNEDKTFTLPPKQRLVEQEKQAEAVATA
ncbi:biotin synthase [Schizosaccharomyces japonicus yFS275]|uniref:biotin synthase n=1 Tax=Schizosaccharomyces japonicus (strain yFS275 / FY16936) TaxID=402676 RepID=B6JZA6_SCHJY|nr:biotin synthase [Schizosaccharomyces japonicus yFS275]EEB06874.1 biotin synthase [Schizosaccharomyces japonicus yFS275]